MKKKEKPAPKTPRVAKETPHLADDAFIEEQVEERLAQQARDEEGMKKKKTS